ncbi:helix-turn-helix domain-containing protein [Streptomyces sp. CB00072]|uniref:helix-turn-helix domain-containing protein n=1 Tax=Streptomyces sp. CB00072 TaxID=1703928 RepID=UPI00093CE1D3|nr:helix-turn-helix domain-containing protein [Streptomyces sp. CB00072]
MAIRDRISQLLHRDHPGTQVAQPLARTPWWVRSFTAAGRPIVAVVVLIMCAPGEHHLAVLAGWDDRLAWGMAGVLAAYAGIAAAVASARPAGAPGQRSAVAGAILSLGAAMAAQPVSHMFVTGHLSSEPRTPLWLVVAVSCVPPLVLGHLLHLAATPIKATAPAEQAPEQPAAKAEQDETDTEPADSEPEPTEQHNETAEPPRFLTTGEVADLYRVSPSTVGTWKQRGKIRPALVDPSLGNLYDPETLPAAG